MKEFFGKFRRGLEGGLDIEPSGDARLLLEAIQREFPVHSKAIDYLAEQLTERRDPPLAYEELSTAGAMLEYVKDKRALLDKDGDFKKGLSADNLPAYLHRYLKRINSGMLMVIDVRATVDKAFFYSRSSEKKGNEVGEFGAS